MTTRYDRRIEIDGDPSTIKECLRIARRHHDLAMIYQALVAWEREHASERGLLELVVSGPDDLSAPRTCPRCKRSLRTAVSRAHGLGPTCHGLSKRLLARKASADLEALAQHANLLGEQLTDVPTSIAQLLAALAFAHQAPTTLAPANNHVTIRTIEFLLSYQLPPPLLPTLHALATALGYHALVNLWRNRFVKRPAQLQCDESIGLLILYTQPLSVLGPVISHSGGGLFFGSKAAVWPITRHRDVAKLLPKHWLCFDDLRSHQAIIRACAWQPPNGWHEPDGFLELMHLWRQSVLYVPPA